MRMAIVQRRFMTASINWRCSENCGWLGAAVGKDRPALRVPPAASATAQFVDGLNRLILFGIKGN